MAMELRSFLGAACLMVLALVVAARPAAADDVLVFAAASLKNALDDAAQDFGKGGDTVRISYGASSALAKQIENGAPADLFISADLDWMNEIAGKGLIKPATRANLLGNTLVLIAPSDSTLALAIAPDFPLAQALGAGRLAMADPDAVPAGKYGKAALQKLGVWDGVAGKVAAAADVRAALRFVSRKEAPLGIVYRTDAAADPGVRIVATFPDGTYPPIIYPIAALASSKSRAADRFLAYLHSPAAKPFFDKQGFAVLP
ncbi:MAG TPA: molybdate ABC transporter substrate-binding protein [Stellaceae bacterium]|nr:molybdate ABC transporter substrate-binding protein [Stellaceae bacterium]